MISTSPSEKSWFTGQNQSATAAAVASAKSAVKLDSPCFRVRTAAGRTKVYYPFTLNSRSHAVTIISGAESLIFTLHIGSAIPPDTTTTTTAPPATQSAELLQAGMGTITLALLALGFLITTTGTTLAYKFRS